MPVELKIAGAMAEIVLSRPDKLNAVNDAMAAELSEVFDRAERVGVRAMLLSGAGAGFCAGRDLADADPGNEDAEAILEGVFNPLIKRLALFPAPTFAAVHGACLGVGLGLALACDVVYAADDAKIGSPFARIGAVLDSGGHSFLVARLGSHRALELIYTGRLLSGAEAAAMGLVNASMPKENLLERARAVATQVANGPTAAFVESKRLIRRIDEEALGLRAVLKCEARAQGAAGRTADYKEGISAFQQKRAPKFVGK
ncbi:MAG TPA: enoyl-CoA hydratase-related protein [Candidatus Binataceae bacterium]|nr:enoyl-CoA hydratase-related protein [Candidatus Binataceae bacterium]